MTSFSFTGAPEDYPEEWVEAARNGALRLRSDRRPYAAQALTVDAAGTIGTTGRRAWFLPGKFRFCPACGDQPAVQAREINKLASLSAEGRSSATTLLVSSALRWMNRNAASLPPERRKLLGFTDNRQDAALQAGHFNDFLFVALLRAATLAAVRAAGPEGLSEDEFGRRLQAAVGIHRRQSRAATRSGCSIPRSKASVRSRPSARSRACWRTARGSTSGAAGGSPIRIWKSWALSVSIMSRSTSLLLTTARSQQRRLSFGQRSPGDTPRSAS